MEISPAARRLLIGLGLLSGFIGFIWIRSAFGPKDSYRRDFVNDYLPAKALLNGANPYLPMPELAKRFDFPLPEGLFPHPTPHTPGLLLLSAPMGLFDYFAANLVWTGLALICLVVAIRLLQLRGGLSPEWALTFLLVWAALGWGPLEADLITGQIDSWLLLLMVLAWLALRSGRQVSGGMLLGAVLSLKLIAWPFGLYLLLRRQWRGLWGIGITVGLAHLAALAAMGGGTIKDYYLAIGPSVSQIYRTYFSNLALTSLGWRLFAGTAESAHLTPNVLVRPLVESVALARFSAWALPSMFLLATLWLARKARSIDTAFGLLLCASLLSGPLCWFHYCTLVMLPMAIVGRRLLGGETRRPIAVFAAILTLFISIPHPVYIETTMRFGAQIPGSAITLIPFAAGLLPTLPAFLVMGWMCLLWKTDRLSPVLDRTA